MTIPSASKMSAEAISSYGQSLGPDGEAYVKALLGAVETAWKSWQGTLKFGKTSVSGSGIGAWIGTSVGGKLGGGTSFNMEVISFKANSPQQVKFTTGLVSALASKFPMFPPSYTITGLAFTGTCTATTLSPGTADAVSTAMPLLTAGSGTNPSGIADLWKNTLTKPDFDLASPQCKSGALIDAIAKTIEKEFQSTWLATAKLIGNKLTAAPATAGSGTVTSVSTEMDGTIS